MPPVSATRNGRGRMLLGGRRELRLIVGRRRNALFDECVPLVAMRALPEQLGAAVAAMRAQMRIEVEDRGARDLDVSRDQRARELQRFERVPNRLMDRERMRVVLERLEDDFQRSLRFAT